MKNKAIQAHNSYFIDVEDGAELVRLIDQDHMITQQMGIFPAPVRELFPLCGEHEYQVLDLACGPGGWALEVAFQVPEVEVVGVDIARSMVQYATMRGQMQGTQNASFEVMDITRPLTFPTASFQYIHARFLVGFLSPAHWLPLIQECKRLLAPGGFLCLTESEWPLTTSAAYEHLTALTSQALKLSGRSLSPDGRHFGVTPMLHRFLQEAGYKDICCNAVALNWSMGTDLHTSFYANCQFAFALLRPFLLKTGVTDDTTFDRLYETMLGEIQSASFCGLVAPLVVWGKVPVTEAAETVEDA